MDELPVLTFASAVELREWLEDNHSTSGGIWVRIYTRRSGLPSVTFDELLDEGLCFGWSESMRRKYDRESYLQRFTPRKASGTQSKRNLDRAQTLIINGKMTLNGMRALGMEK